MNKILVIINFLLFSLISFAQEDTSIYLVKISNAKWKQQYIKNPNPTDSTCLSDINRAKADIANGKIVYTLTQGFMSRGYRCESELRQICKDYGLVFEHVLNSDSYYEGQIPGCYGAYMDKVIADKYGSDFKDRLYKIADSLFLDNVIKSNKAIGSWYCDERPRLPNEAIRYDDYIPSLIAKDIDIEENKGGKGDWPFIDFGFVVEMDGSISGFDLNGFVPVLDINKKYESELFDLAVKYMNDKYPKWIPGKINGQTLRTKNNVRIKFRKE